MEEVGRRRGGVGKGLGSSGNILQGNDVHCCVLLMLCIKAHGRRHSPSASVWFGGSCLALFPGSVIKLNGGAGN